MIADKKTEINILFSCYFNKTILVGSQISVNFFTIYLPLHYSHNTYRTLNTLRVILCQVQQGHAIGPVYLRLHQV